MELTQQDYEERKSRIDAGTASDDDRRLVKHYERQGFSLGAVNPFEQDAEVETQASGTDYRSMTKRELKALLDDRKIDHPSSANNDTLAEMLEQHDRARQEPPL